MPHTTLWEDAGTAGVRCNGIDADLVLDSEQGPKRCPICGITLKLSWHVSIEELKE